MGGLEAHPGPLVERRTGGRARRAGLDDPAEGEGVEPVRPLAGGRAVGRCARTGSSGVMVTTLPPPRPRRVSTIPAVRKAVIASRRVARETSSRSASSRSDGSVVPIGWTPSRIAVASCSTQASKAW